MSNVDQKNLSGKTALHIAAQLGLESLVQEMLSANASTDVKDNEGITPREYAAWNFHYGVIKLLENNKGQLPNAGTVNQTYCSSGCL